ncbi:MAG: PEGA domain-containing protein [Myxococcota bacterium]
MWQRVSRAVVFAGVLLAAGARAELRRLATAVVAPGEVSDVEVLWVEHAVKKVVASDARFEHVSLGHHARDAAANREVKELEAKRLHKEATDAFDNLDYSGALEKVKKAQRFLEESELTRGVGALLDAMALKALIHFARNERAEFSNEVSRVLALNPKYSWDRARLTPATSAAIEPLRKKLAAVQRIQLEVQSHPVAGWVYVDGVFRGVSPVTVADLAPGNHYLAVLANGFELWQEQVFAGSGQPVKVALVPAKQGKELLALLSELRGALEKTDGEAQAAKLTQWGLAEEILVVSLEGKKGKRQARALRIGYDGAVLAEKEGGADGERTAMVAAVEKLAREALSGEAPKKLAGLGEEPGVETAPSEPKMSKRTLGMVVGGSGLAALLGGSVLGLSAMGKAREANALPQVREVEYARAASSAKWQAGIADGLFTAGVAATVVGIVFLATAPDDEVEEDEETVVLAPLGPGGLGVSLEGRF